MYLKLLQQEKLTKATQYNQYIQSTIQIMNYISSKIQVCLKIVHSESTPIVLLLNQYI